MTRFSLCVFLNIGWVPCWFRLQTKATHAKPCCKRRLTMGKVPWGSMLGSMLVFRVWGRSPWERYCGGPCWVPCWLPCWFPVFRVWGRSPWERYHGGPCWLPCWLPCWFPAVRVWGWERYRGGTCWVPCWHPCWFPAVRVWGRSPWERYNGGLGFQLSGYGGGHHGRGTVRVLQADLPLLGRSLRAVASPVESTRNLTWNPVNVPVALAPGGPAWSFPCWVEVLEQVSPAGSTWNLTWNPLSVPGALAPGGSGRRSSQREGYNEKMKNVTFMVGKWEKVSA